MFGSMVNEALNEALPNKYKAEKPKVKCRLKECEKLTDHNGGYCSAEHCKEDVARIRAKR